MELDETIDTNGKNTRKNTQINYYEEERVEDVWRDLVGIAPDPPDQREKCEYCL